MMMGVRRSFHRTLRLLRSNPATRRARQQADIPHTHLRQQRASMSSLAAAACLAGPSRCPHVRTAAAATRRLAIATCSAAECGGCPLPPSRVQRLAAAVQRTAAAAKQQREAVAQQLQRWGWGAAVAGCTPVCSHSPLSAPALLPTTF